MQYINEAFEQNFRLDELNRIKSFNGKLKYCKEHLGPTFGKGSSRVVFDFTDDAVLKLAYNQKGVAQNREEYDMSRNDDIVVKCLDVADDYSWIIQENVLPAKQKDFQQCLGISWNDFTRFVCAVFNLYGRYPRRDAMDDDEFEYWMEENENFWWFREFNDYMTNWQLPYGDLCRISSYGMAMREEGPMIVVLDSGLTEEVWNNYYNKWKLEETLDEEENNDKLQEDVSISPFEPKEELHPKFWVNNKLNSKVRMRLLDIADDFVKTLDIKWVKPDDIVLTGSLANYNWTKYSDVDIHIIMDFKKVYKKTDFVKSYFDAKKLEWNSSHEGLKIYGFNVEMSVEDKNAPAAASGVYSLEKNDWVSEPKDLSDAKLNKDYVESTAEKFIGKIDALDKRIRKEKDAKKVEILSNKMISIFNKLKGMRREGLKQRAKEMSSGNIIWKILRAEGYIKKIWDIVNYNYDRSMSLNEAVTGKDNKKASALYVYALDKMNGEWHLLCARRANRKSDEERGKWNPPMGHVHRGEEMLDGAIRECFEESGVDFEDYKNKIRLMDSHRWGNNYRLVLKDKYTKDFKPGDGDEENDDFIWLPVRKIKDKTWAWSCGENAEKYCPKTVIIKEKQKEKIRESAESGIITLYHGAPVDKLEYNLEHGGFVPRVCAEGGPEAIWLSEKPHEYSFIFKFEFPRELLGKKLIQQSNIDYTYDDFIGFDEFNCELVKTSIYEYGHNLAVQIDLRDVEMCKRQYAILPDAFETFNEHMKKYPLVYKNYVEPVLAEIGFSEKKIRENKN